MASTFFVDGTTPVVASWLNDVNNFVYSGSFPGSVTVSGLTTLNGNLIVPGTATIGTLVLTSLNSTPVGNITPSTGGFTTLSSTTLNVSTSASLGTLSTSSGTFTGLLTAPQANIGPPASGTALTVNLAASNYGIAIATAGGNAAVLITGPSAMQLTALTWTQLGQTNWAMYQPASSGDLRFYCGGDRLVIASGGNVTINAPTSGTALTVSASASGTAISFPQSNGSLFSAANGGPDLGWIFNNTTAGHQYTLTANNSGLFEVYDSTRGATAWSIGPNGNFTIAAPASGISLTVNAVSGTHSTKIADSANTLYNAGFLELPVNSAGATYTAVLADAGKSLYYNGTGATTYTIPANGSVAYPIGTTLTFINDATGATNMTIAITTDTLVLSPGGSTTSRTLAQFGRATAHKVTATRWIISGSGLT